MFNFKLKQLKLPENTQELSDLSLIQHKSRTQETLKLVFE